MKKLFMSIVLVSLMFVCFTGPAMAAMATATATIDLSGLQNYGGFTWNVSSSTGATALNNTKGDTSSNGPTNGWSATQSSASVANASATGTAANGLYTSVASTTEVGYNSPQSAAYAGLNPILGSSPNTASFSYAGPAVQNLVFSIPWSFSYTLDVTNGPQAYAYAAYGLWVNMTLADNNYSFKIDSNEAYKGIGSPIQGTTDSGVFNFAFNMPSGQVAPVVGAIDFGTYAKAQASAVPIPAAFWLLGTGLVGLVGIRRKRILS